MRKTHLLAGILVTIGMVGVSAKSSADLIVNGDFSAGPSGPLGFTSDYTEDSSAGAGANAGPSGNDGAGYYGIVADSQYWHPSFVNFEDHTQDASAVSDLSNIDSDPDAGYMMIVNGSIDTPNPTVWSEDNIAVTPGGTYLLSFWAASCYPVSPATLNVTAAVNALNHTFAISATAGTWQQFTVTFTADHTPTTISLIDTNTAFNGNDFALDDISLTLVQENSAPTPLPASVLSGSVLLAGIAVTQKIRRGRRN